MWSFDGSRTSVPDYNFVAFPPRGYTPIGCFHDNYAWNVSLNPRSSSRPAKDRSKWRSIPSSSIPMGTSWRRPRFALPLNYFHVSPGWLRNPLLRHFPPGQLQNRRR